MDFPICDESKCVSRGMSHVYNDSFTCYGDDGAFYPRMCADGFLPVVVEDEPLGFDGSGDATVTVRYFTCCPPDRLVSEEEPDADGEADAEADFARRCSDPISAPIDNEVDTNGVIGGIDTICDDQLTRTFIHPMKASVKMIFDVNKILASTTTADSFLCCDYGKDDDSDDDSNVENNATIATANNNYLGVTECVPYRNEFYDAGRAQNEIGASLYNPITCDFESEEFLFPRPIDGDDLVSIGRHTYPYQCCKTGPPLPLYVIDPWFQIDVGIGLALWILAAIASSLIVIGLTVPLLIQLKKGSYQRATKRRSSQARASQPFYSSYNLYLVYISIPDLIFSLWMISHNVRGIHQKPYIDGLLTWSVSGFWSMTNLCINAITCHQVLCFLKASRLSIRIQPPSLTRVNVQCGAAYFLGVLTFCVNYFFHDSIAVDLFQMALFLPIVYVIYVSIVVWWRNYLPSTTGISVKNRAMRELAIFFFRITFVLVVVWTPGVVCAALSTARAKGWGLYVLVWCSTIQVIAQTCLILTKSDVRRYILNLVTLRDLRGSRTPERPSCPSTMFATGPNTTSIDNST